MYETFLDISSETGYSTYVYDQRGHGVFRVFGVKLVPALLGK